MRVSKIGNIFPDLHWPIKITNVKQSYCRHGPFVPGTFISRQHDDDIERPLVTR